MADPLHVIGLQAREDVRGESAEQQHRHRAGGHRRAGHGRSAQVAQHVAKRDLDQHSHRVPPLLWSTSSPSRIA